MVRCRLLFKCYRHINSSIMSIRSSHTVAVCQVTSTGAKDDNFNACVELIQKAKEAQASMVFLPEGCDYIASSKEESFSLAEDENGPTVQKYKQVAKENNIWISLGGIHFISKVESKLTNSSILIDSDGNVVGRYDKTHLFDVDIPEKKIRLLESGYVASGNKIVPPIETPIGKVGLAICYDMRFPEMSLTLRQMGAEILTFPSAFTFETGKSHWEILLRARAIENQCYVIAAAQTGAHNAKRRSWGHAMIIDPWGNIIAECKDEQGLAIATIDLPYLLDVRKKMPVAEHRRTDLYPAMPSAIKEQPVYTFGQVKVSRQSVFYTSPLSIAFTNKRCVVTGHVLVAPIRVALRVSDLSPAEVADLFNVVQKVETVMEQITGTKSTTIVVQDGPDAGQSIQHVHVHILPRKPGDFARNDDIYDELFKEQASEKPWRTEQEMCDEATNIRKYFSQYSRVYFLNLNYT